MELWCILKKTFGIQEHGLIQNGAALSLAVITFLIGDPTKTILVAVLVLIGLDFILGFVSGILCRDLSVDKMTKGGVKIILYFTLMIIAKYAVLVDGTIFALVDNLIYAYIGVAEIVSILNTLIRVDKTCGLNIPFLESLSGIIKGRAALAQKKLEEAAEEAAEKLKVTAVGVAENLATKTDSEKEVPPAGPVKP